MVGVAGKSVLKKNAFTLASLLKFSSESITQTLNKRLFYREERIASDARAGDVAVKQTSNFGTLEEV